ncbi:MAG TPA: hypothetical protein VEY11_18545 [Pyrinomonadaceae bacterium]|nr:hypothetical protein [Pyrinomonadaceae bacterium]
MQPKPRRYRLTSERIAERILKLRSAATTLAFTLVLVLIPFALLSRTCYQQYTLTGDYAREYEGKILDKSQTITESHTGSGVRRRLLLEGRDGARFEVAIGAETYERARKGMWIRKTSAGVELSWPTPATAESSAPEPGH